MLFFRHYFFQFVLTCLCVSRLNAAGTAVKKEPVVPNDFAFVRSLDIDTFVERTNWHGLGAQSGRLRLRYLDPEVNAFAGLLASFHHFNQDLRIGNPEGPDTAGVLANWGGDFGIVRGKHLWELDLEGANLSQRLGFAMAVVGEHHLSSSWTAYHRTEINVFTGDAILDADQGIYWMWSRSVGLSFGYRWFTSSHMDRSGPHAGVRLYFESPKIPFLFPSIG
jgi:hypothetical protein